MITNSCRCPDDRCNVLARRYRDGDADAGNEIMIAYGPLVHAIVVRVLGPTRRMEWEDATQTAFLHGLMAVSQWKENCPFCCFLAVVVARRCIDFARHLDIDRHVLLTEENTPVSHAEDCDKEFLNRYEHAIKRFPAKYTVAWQLYLDDLTISQIAERLGVSERTVYYRLALVKSELARVFDEYG